MSINSEIERLQNAKSALKTAIEGKGVSVPASTKLDAYPALVDSIEAGGGGGGDDNWYFVTADSGTTSVENNRVRQIYLGFLDSSHWLFRAHLIGSSAQGLSCWFRYKGEDYFVDSFSDGRHALSKQGAPVSCTISEFISILIFNNNGVYEVEYYED